MIMKKSERGQIIVILALSMVALIGITALAVEGSLLFNSRRQDQNTADSAALAGAGAIANYLKEIESGTLICGKAVGTQATILAVNAVHAAVAVDGISAAEMPKLANDTDLAAADQGFTVSCNWYGGLGTQYLDVHVKMSTESNTSFARVVGTNTLKTSVDSTARVYPRQPLMYGNGLVSLSDQCGTKIGGISFAGASETYINNGGVFSNSCLVMLTGEVGVTGGAIQYWHESTCSGCKDNPHVSPLPNPAYTKLPKNLIKAPTCPAKTAGNTHSAFKGIYSGTIYPGWYTTGINMDNVNPLELAPGLYCIEGGMSNNAQANMTGNGVTLYFLSGDVTLNQNEKGGVVLSSCQVTPCGDPTAVQGLLMFFDPGYSPTVKINGGSNNAFKGTIFGPTANFSLNGNSDTAGESYVFSSQIVGNYISISGKAQLSMDLNAKDFVAMEPVLSLVK